MSKENRSAASTTRRGALALLLVLASLASVGASAAQAGQITVVVNARGSGQVFAIPSGQSCNRLANLDDRVTLPCGTMQQNFFGITIPMTLQAIANGSPPGNWVATFGSGCDAGNGTPVCTIVDSGNFNTRVANVTVVFDDVALPVVSAGGAPNFSTTLDRTVRFPMTANEPSALACSIDNSPTFTACTTAKDFTLAEGPHNVRVRATDGSGNTATSAALPFSILDTKLVSGPPSFSPSTSATIKFSTLAGFSFDCALDGAPLVDCGNKLGDNTLSRSFTNLAQGAHTFTVRARNGVDIDHVPLRHTWTVDTVAPNTALDPLVGPRDGEVSTLLTASFAMSASEPATIQCRLDGSAYATCPATRAFVNLGFGQHQFDARAIDRAGNVDATPISRIWTVLAVDNDGDGFNQRSDCDDTDPLVRPGAREVAGNDVDENCDGFKAPPPRMTSTTVPNSWSVLGKRATITRLEIKRLRAGARVELRCIGKKCSFKRVKAKGKAKRGTLNVLKSLTKKQRRFRAGQTLEIRITAPRVIGKVVRYPIRAGKIPKAKELCLPPRTTKPVKCA